MIEKLQTTKFWKEELLQTRALKLEQDFSALSRLDRKLQDTFLWDSTELTGLDVSAAAFAVRFAQKVQLN